MTKPAQEDYILSCNNNILTLNEIVVFPGALAIARGNLKNDIFSKDMEDRKRKLPLDSVHSAALLVLQCQRKLFYVEDA